MDDDTDRPVPLSRLADLQAGLLADDDAARLRRRARTDPDTAGRLAALDRVRGDVAALGVDAASAPEVPTAVTTRVATALRALPTPITTVAKSPAGRWRGAAAAAGLLAAVAAAGVGSVVLLRDRGPEAPAGGATSPSQARNTGGVPLTDREMLDLLTRPVDPGPLAAPQRLASCLSGLGYPMSTSPLGARPLTVNGTPGVLLLLAGDPPGHLDAVVVAPNCSSIDTGLLARSVLDRS